MYATYSNMYACVYGWVVSLCFKLLPAAGWFTPLQFEQLKSDPQLLLLLPAPLTTATTSSSTALTKITVTEVS